MSLEWLRDYAPLDAPVEALAERLVESGTEVDRIERGGEGVVITRVLALEAIPEATRGVRLATIDTGVGGTVRLVTGAPNLRPGDLVPWARPGTFLPGATEPLGVRAMFGGRYQSPGMLCSAAELGVGEDADGILVLEGGEPGRPVTEVLGLDTVLDVAVTTNRPDCLCHVGIARELAAALGDPLTEPPDDIPAVLASAASARGRVRVRIADPAACPRFAAAIIEGVAVRPSPEWLRRRLRSVGVRPVNNVVDVTNYVARELGQPLHAFDLQLFQRASGAEDGAAEVLVRRGRDEPLLGLDGVERTLGGEDIVVCSGDRPVSIAGVMGGAATAVDETTTAVLLEAASWDGPSIRATSRRLGLRSDASALFEKGLSDTLVPIALNRAAALVAELAGGHVLRDPVDERPTPPPPVEPIELTPEYLSRTLGYEVDASEAATALARLGFGVEQETGLLRVAPPHFRRDVLLPVDVIEEVGRSLGYGRVPGTLPGRRHPAGAPVDAEQRDEDRVRDVLVGAGFDEVITYSFTAPAIATLVPGVGEGVAPLPISNPLTDDWGVLRTSLLPGLCQTVAANLRHGLAEMAVFELGRAFWEGRRQGAPEGTIAALETPGQPALPAEPLLLGLAVHCPDDADAAAAGLRLARSALDEVVRELAGEVPAAEPAGVRGCRPGRSGVLRVGGERAGVFGELLPASGGRLELRGRVVVAELHVDAIARPAARVPRYRPPPRFPAIVQDLAVVVPAGAAAGAALAVLREAGAPLLEAVELYDEHRDDRFGPEHKGWTFRLIYRAADRTLTGEEAGRQQAAMAAALRERCGATIRE